MAKPHGLIVATIPAPNADREGALDHLQPSALFTRSRNCSVVSAPVWRATMVPSALTTNVVGIPMPFTLVSKDPSVSRPGSDR